MSVETRLRKLSNLAFIYNAYKLKTKIDEDCPKWSRRKYPYETTFVIKLGNSILSHVVKGNDLVVHTADNNKNLENYTKRIKHYESALEDLQDLEIHINLCYANVCKAKTGAEMKESEWVEWVDIIKEEKNALMGILDTTTKNKKELQSSMV